MFSGPVLADLFLGRITRWNAPELAELNPGLALPDRPVDIVHRSDGSGTTFVLTDYLSKVSGAWAKGPGRSTSINWPVGRGAKGNDGVAADVGQNEGSLGYVELVYAVNNDIPYGDVVNAGGRAVRASVDSTTAAAAPFDAPTPDLRVSLTDAKSPGAYPISSFTWIVLYREQPDYSKGKALTEFLWWAVHDGQAMARPMHYGPLPSHVLPRVEAELRSIEAQGRPVAPAD